jgi:hypothetical protein
MCTGEPTGVGMMRTAVAGAGLGLALMVGVGSAASGAVVASDAGGVVVEDSVQARLQETPASGGTLAATAVGFLALGAGAVFAAQRRRWGSLEASEGEADIDLGSDKRLLPEQAQ